MQSNRKGSESSLRSLVPLRLSGPHVDIFCLQSFGSTWLCLVEGFQGQCQRLLGRILTRLGTAEALQELLGLSDEEEGGGQQVREVMQLPTHGTRNLRGFFRKK